ncbi:MAG: NAD-dependent epimerase/dehydratase family protein [Myxococcales bacterium]|nr:NAD-dependent epimerase/dehydratase family protein [Myxococcales bacterium]
MTELANKRIFITGGAGFIGSTLIGRLVEDNEIVVYDNLARDSLKDKPYKSHKNLRVIKGDVLDAAGIGEAIQGANVVVHCAAIAGIDTVSKSPVTTLRVNMLGSANVLEAAAKLPACERVLCFSTSEVFGQHAFRVTEASGTSVGAVGEPRWAYAVGKLAEEHLAIMYHRELGLPSVVVRPFNVYGPGQVGEGALRNFIMRALADEPIDIYGDGSQIRAWCYVDDMVDAVLAGLTHPKAVGESFNVGNERAVATTFGLAEAVVRVLGSKSPIRFVPRDTADVQLRVPSTAKCRDLIGVVAKVNLDEGIRRTAEFYRAARGAGA